MTRAVNTAAVGIGGVIQVLQSVKADTYTTSSGSWIDVPSLSVTITPTSSTSKILVFLSISGVGQTTTGSTARIARNGTGIGVADSSAGSRNAGGTAEFFSPRTDDFKTYTSVVLDSPATTSAVTYTGQVIVGGNGGGGSYVVYINRSAGDANSNGYTRGVSSITVLEIAG